MQCRKIRSAKFLLKALKLLSIERNESDAFLPLLALRFMALSCLINCSAAGSNVFIFTLKNVKIISLEAHLEFTCRRKNTRKSTKEYQTDDRQQRRRRRIVEKKCIRRKFYCVSVMPFSESRNLFGANSYGVNMSEGSTQIFEFIAVILFTFIPSLPLLMILHLCHFTLVWCDVAFWPRYQPSIRYIT